MNSYTAKCPHCMVVAEFDGALLTPHGSAGHHGQGGWHFKAHFEPRSLNKPDYDLRVHLCRNCGEAVVRLNDYMIFPNSYSRPPCPTEVPIPIKDDYEEACKVLPHSAKAAGALARRCLQHILRDQGFVASDLNKEIDLAIADKKKGLPADLIGLVDMMRHLGNFSTHPLKYKSVDQIVPVEPNEAEVTIEILEALFDFYYVRPSRNAARVAAFQPKLVAAGKPSLKNEK